MKKPFILLISVMLVLTLALSGCQLIEVTPTSPGTATTPPTVTALSDIETTLESIYENVNPSVVNISVLLQDGQAGGSGFVWDNSGNIVTNNHVVADASDISVIFYDGTIVSGEVIGTDPDSDLAVVKVDASADQLKPVQVADSTQLKVGQVAIAIGNPFGLQGTMTVGIISGLGRLLPASENPLGPNYSIPDIIQTDAAINPGNSGGVLLDDTGKVIGVTSSIATTTGTSAGVGFAIPSAIVQKVVPALISSGRYDHPYLGVTVVSLTPDIAQAVNLPSNQRGALVVAVTAGSPAEKGGLRGGQSEITINSRPVSVGGDVVIAYEDRIVKSSDDLVTYLARYGSVGQTATLTVLRDGNQVTITVTIGVRPTS